MDHQQEIAKILSQHSHYSQQSYQQQMAEPVKAVTFSQHPPQQFVFSSQFQQHQPPAQAMDGVVS